MIHSKIDNLTVAKFEETILIFFSFYLPFPLKIPHPVLKDRIKKIYILKQKKISKYFQNSYF